MSLRHLSINDFRGIDSLEWNVTESLCCLFGPGDSGKSTILDAIHLALLPSWTFEVSDSDFWECTHDPEYPIVIKATVGCLPPSLTTEKNFGLHLRGWSKEDGIVDEPSDNHEPVITIQLTINDFYEPIWRVITDRNPDGVPISAHQRSLIGVLIISPNTKDNFAWGKGALMSRATTLDQDALGSIFLGARKAVKESIDSSNLENLETLTNELTTEVLEYGVSPEDKYNPKIDMRKVRVNQGAICLHDGNIPVHNLGSGTQKLINLALFKKTFRENGTIGIDELETGLEPHRIRQLISKLKKENNGTTIITTHSPVVLKELDWNNLFFVHNKQNDLTIKQMKKDTRPVIRYVPEAFLAKRVLFCEGKTEIGLLRGMNDYWASQDLPSLWTQGVELVDGGGDDMFKRATAFLKSGYEVCCFMDSDKLEQLQPKIDRFIRAGGTVVRWDQEFSTEEAVVDCIPEAGLRDLWCLVIDRKGLAALKNSLLDQDDYDFELNDDIVSWCDNNDINELKNVTAKKAKKQEWFKRVDLAEDLAHVISDHLEEMEDSDLANKLNELKEWIHDNA